jgi:hypothetical protein
MLTPSKTNNFVAQFWLEYLTIFPWLHRLTFRKYNQNLAATGFLRPLLKLMISSIVYFNTPSWTSCKRSLSVVRRHHKLLGYLIEGLMAINEADLPSELSTSKSSTRSKLEERNFLILSLMRILSRTVKTWGHLQKGWQGTNHQH